MSSKSHLLNILSTYLLGKCLYTKVNYQNPVIGVFYNILVHDILTVVPYEMKDQLDRVAVFSDYITLISDSTTKIEYPQEDIGIVYIDPKASSEADSIVVARLPTLHTVDDKVRKEFLKPFFKQGTDIQQPFWNEYGGKHPVSAISESKDFSKAKELIDKAIQTYCKQNNFPRENISSYHQFAEFIAPDVLKFKMSVADELQMRTEAEQLDKGSSQYPDILLKALYTLELVA